MMCSEIDTASNDLNESIIILAHIVDKYVTRDAMPKTESGDLISDNETTSAVDIDYSEETTRTNSMKSVNVRSNSDIWSTMISLSSASQISESACSSNLEGMVSSGCRNDIGRLKHTSNDLDSKYNLSLKEIKVSDMCATANNVHMEEDNNHLQKWTEQSFSQTRSKSSPYFPRSTIKGLVWSLPLIANNSKPNKAKSETLLPTPLTTSFHKHTHCAYAGLIMMCPYASIHMRSEPTRNPEYSLNMCQNLLQHIHDCDGCVTNIITSEGMPKLGSADLSSQSLILHVDEAFSTIDNSGGQIGKCLTLKDNFIVGESTESKEKRDYDDVVEEGALSKERKCIHTAHTYILRECQCEQDFDKMSVRLKKDNVRHITQNESSTDQSIKDITQDEVSTDQSITHIIQDDFSTKQSSKDITQAKLSMAQSIKCGGFLSNPSENSNRIFNMQFNTLCSHTHKDELEMFSYLQNLLDEMIHIVESNHKIYGTIDQEDTDTTSENAFTDYSLITSANRNKSGNSGYNSTRKPVTQTRNRYRKLESVTSGSQHTSLQSCLEKARLACTLHETIGRMRTRAENYAAAMAYEKSVKRFEKSMKDFLRESAGSTDLDTLRESSSATADNEQSSTHQGKEYQETENKEKKQKDTKYLKTEHQFKHKALRRSNTFVVVDPGTSQVPYIAKHKRCIPLRTESNRSKQIINMKRFNTTIDKNTFVSNLDSKKTTQSSPTILLTEHHSNIPVKIIHKSQSHRTKPVNTVVQSNTSRRLAISKWRHSVKNSDCTDNVQSVVTNIPITMMQTSKQIHASSSLNLLLDYNLPDKNNIQEQYVQSRNKQADTEYEKYDVNENPKPSEVCFSNKKDTDCSQHVDSILDINLLLINKAAHDSEDKCKSLNVDCNVSRKDKSDNEPATTIDKEEHDLDKLTNSGGNFYLPAHDCLTENMTADDVSKRSSAEDFDCIVCIESEMMKPEASPQNNEYTNDSESMAADDQTFLSQLVLSGIVSDTSKQQGQCSYEESPSSLGYKCDTSRLENMHLLSINGIDFHLDESKTFAVCGECSQGCSTSVSPGRDNQKVHNKWQLHSATEKPSFSQLRSDSFVSRADCSFSDDDTETGLQHSLSRSGLFKNRHIVDAEMNLREISLYCQTRKESQRSHTKRTSTGVPRWVKNAGHSFPLNDCTRVADVSVNTGEEKFSCSEKSDKIHSKQDCISQTEQESNILQVPLTVSRLFHSHFEEEKEAMKDDGVTYKDKKMLVNVNNEESFATSKCDQMKPSEAKNITRSINLETTLEDFRPSSFPLPMYHATCSSASNTRDDSTYPASCFSPEGRAVSNPQNDNYKYTFKCLSCSDFSQTIIHDEKDIKSTPVLNDLSSDKSITISVTAKKSSSHKHLKTFSNTLIQFGTASRATFIDRSGLNIPGSENYSCDYEQNVDRRGHCSSQETIELEQLVREVFEPGDTTSPYPVSTATLEEDQVQEGQQCEQFDLNMEQYDIHWSRTNKTLKRDKPRFVNTPKTELDTIKKYSEKSPPKCVYNNKQVSCSNFVNMSTVVINDLRSRMCGPGEIAEGESYQSSVVGDELNSLSPLEKVMPKIISESSVRSEKKQFVTLGSHEEKKSSEQNYFFACSSIDEKPVVKVKHKSTVNPHFPLSVSKRTTDSETNLTQLQGHNMKQDVLAGNESQLRVFQYTTMETEHQIIQKLNNKIDRLEKMLAQNELRSQSFHCRTQTFQGTIDPVTSRQGMSCPYCLHVQGPDSQMISFRQHGRILHPNCYTQIIDNNFDERPRDWLFKSQCSCAEHSCCYRQADNHHAEMGYFVQNENMSFAATRRQNSENWTQTDCFRSEACTYVDHWTQYDSDMSCGGKQLNDDLSMIRQDIQQMKHFLFVPDEPQSLQGNVRAQKNGSLMARNNTADGQSSLAPNQALHGIHFNMLNKPVQTVQEALLSLYESLSYQRKEIEEISSRTEKIASSLENRCHVLMNKGMDYDKLKERIVELTSQRDAEKVFHKITREALRALERDHDRLRQEYVTANCRRYKDGGGIVQKRMWYYLKSQDRSQYCFNNCSNMGDMKLIARRESLGQTRMGTDTLAAVKYETCGQQHSQFQDKGVYSNHRRLPMGSYHFTSDNSMLELSTSDYSNTLRTESNDIFKCEIEKSIPDRFLPTLDSKEQISFSSYFHKASYTKNSGLHVTCSEPKWRHLEQQRVVHAPYHEQIRMCTPCRETDLCPPSATTKTESPDETPTRDDTSYIDGHISPFAVDELETSMISLTEDKECINSSTSLHEEKYIQ